MKHEDKVRDWLDGLRLPAVPRHLRREADWYCDEPSCAKACTDYESGFKPVWNDAVAHAEATGHPVHASTTYVYRPGDATWEGA